MQQVTKIQASFPRKYWRCHKSSYYSTSSFRDRIIYDSLWDHFVLVESFRTTEQNIKCLVRSDNPELDMCRSCWSRLQWKKIKNLRSEVNLFCFYFSTSSSAPKKPSVAKSGDFPPNWRFWRSCWRDNFLARSQEGFGDFQSWNLAPWRFLAGLLWLFGVFK